ncbi:hypothetical protein BJX99DRAFT_221393 [Aspergillus californicus]
MNRTRFAKGAYFTLPLCLFWVSGSFQTCVPLTLTALSMGGLYLERYQTFTPGRSDIEY